MGKEKHILDSDPKSSFNVLFYDDFRLIPIYAYYNELTNGIRNVANGIFGSISF